MNALHKGSRKRKVARTSDRAVKALEICQDPSNSSTARIEAIRFLGRCRFKDAVPTLICLLREGPDEIRSASGSALEEIGSRTATKPLIRILKKHPSFLAREWAAIILFVLGDRQAEGILTRVLNDSAEPEYLRGRAAQALGMIRPSTTSVPSLIHALSDPSAEVRYSAICGLSATQGRRGIAAATAGLEKLTKDPAELSGEGSVGELATQVLEVLRHRTKKNSADHVRRGNNKSRNVQGRNKRRTDRKFRRYRRTAIKKARTRRQRG